MHQCGMACSFIHYHSLPICDQLVHWYILVAFCFEILKTINLFNVRRNINLSDFQNVNHYVKFHYVK